MQIEQSIARGCDDMGLALPPGATARLAGYLELLARWNRAYNLTAVRDPAEMVGRHVLDSLSVLPWLRGPRVCDVGSGAGLPGIPLALARPDTSWVLLDSAGKRTRFMTQAVAELGLTNVEVVQARVEAYRPQAPFDQVISRAFAALVDFAAGAGHLCAPDGELLAMKGQVEAAELSALPAAFRVGSIHVLRVPGTEGARHLVCLKPQAGDGA